jgi:hypothetical protein
MSKISIKIFLSIGLFLFLFSCTVQKRIHKPGYFVQWNKNYKSQSKELKEDKQLEIALNEIETKDNIIPSSITINELNEEASLYLKDEVETSLIKQHYVTEEKCDIIFFKDGKEVEANVKEISDDFIKYTPCNSEGPIYSISTSKIFMIKYATGTKEMFDVEEKKVEYYDNRQNKTLGNENEGPDIAGIIGFVLGLFGLISVWFLPILGGLLGLTALILGIVSLSKRTKNKGFGVASLILGILTLIFIILVFVLALAIVL